MKKYIDLNTQPRTKAENDYEKDFDEKKVYLSSNFKLRTFFSEDLAAFHIKSKKLNLLG